MRADKVVEEDEHGNEVVGNVIVGAFHTDVFYPMQRLNRHPAGKVAVAHNGLRSPHGLHGFQNDKCLGAVPRARLTALSAFFRFNF